MSDKYDEMAEDVIAKINSADPDECLPMAIHDVTMTQIAAALRKAAADEREAIASMCDNDAKRSEVCARKYTYEDRAIFQAEAAALRSVAQILRARGAKKESDK